VADFLVPYLRLLNMCLQIDTMIDVIERYLARINRLRDNQKVVPIRHQYVYALFYNRDILKWRPRSATLRR
jgi:hypothetical protein